MTTRYRLRAQPGALARHVTRVKTSIARPRRCLITGAAGFLGSYLALELLARSEAELYLLVRASGNQSASARLHERLLRSLVDSGHSAHEAARLLASYGPRLHVIEGDLCALGSSLAGLGPIDQVFHVAGVMHFDEARRAEVFATNVAGTRNLLAQLAELPIGAFNFVSTAYVAGAMSGTVPEGPAPSDVAPSNPYEASKREAEQLVLDACAARGVCARIMRPSIIVGDSRTGRADSDVGLYGFLSLIARMRKNVSKHIPDYFTKNTVKIPSRSDVALNFIPVDCLARMMAELSLSPEASGYIHLANPSPVPLAWMMERCGDAYGIALKAGFSTRDLTPSEYVMTSKTRIYDCYLNQHKQFALDTCERLCPEALRATAVDHAVYVKMVDVYKAEHEPAPVSAPRVLAPVSPVRVQVVAKPERLVPARGGEAFRALLDGPGLIALPGCFDVLSALLLEQAGFPAVFVSGYGVAASTLGSPDIGLTTLTETLDVARRVTAQLRVPVVLDLDNGYGDIDNTVRAIRGAEAAGVAAVQFEDQVLPKRCGHAEGKRVLDMDTALRKLEAALDARERDLCIIARTDASDLDEAIARACRFRAAGADATIVDGLRSHADLCRVAREVPGPKQLNLIQGGKTPLVSEAEAEALGFKILLYSTPLLYAATQAMTRAARSLRASGTLATLASNSMGFDEFQTLLAEQHQKSAPAPRRAHSTPPPAALAVTSDVACSA